MRLMQLRSSCCSQSTTESTHKLFVVRLPSPFTPRTKCISLGALTNDLMYVVPESYYCKSTVVPNRSTSRNTYIRTIF